ncbi:MAG: tetratricopeptide repeat protein [bacterium]
MSKRFFLFFCMIVVGFGFSQQVSGDSLVKMLEMAKLFYNNGEYENAIKQLEDALQYLKQLNQSEQVEAYKYLAFSYVAFGDKEKAKDQFKKALLLEPKIRT